MKNIVTLLIACLFSGALLAGCGGGGAASANDPNLHTDLRAFSLALTPSQVEAKDIASFTAEIRDQNGNAVPNIGVVFEITAGVGSLTMGTAKTNAAGIAETSLRSTQKGFITVKAVAQQDATVLSKVSTVYFSQDLQKSANMSIDVDGDHDGIWNEPADFHLLADGATTLPLRIRLTDTAGFPISGRGIQFISDYPDIMFPLGKTAVTDNNGVASREITAPNKIRQSTAHFLLAAYDPLSGAYAMTTIALDPVQIGTVAVNARPTSVPQLGVAKVTVKANYTTGATPPDGMVVALTATNGQIDSFAEIKDGVVTADYTNDGSIGNATVSATVGGVTGTAAISIFSTLAVAPAKASVVGVLNPDTNTADDVTFTVTGGVAPYGVVSNNGAANPSSPTIAKDGGTFMVDPTAVAVPTTVTFTVTDAKGATATATLDIGATVSVDPATASVKGIKDPTDTKDNIVFTIWGGLPPYVVTSSNDAVAAASPTSVSASGGTFMANPTSVTANTAVTFTVTDALGVKVYATLTVTP